MKTESKKARTADTKLPVPAEAPWAGGQRRHRADLCASLTGRSSCPAYRIALTGQVVAATG